MRSVKVGANVACGEGETASSNSIMISSYVTESSEVSSLSSLSHPFPVHSVGDRVGDSEGDTVGVLVLDLWRRRWRRLLRRWAPLSVAVDGVRASAVRRMVIIFIVAAMIW